MTCTIDGELQVNRVTSDSWRVHFPGGERADVIICDQAVSVLTDPYIHAAVEAVIEFETRRWTEAGFISPASLD